MINYWVFGILEALMRVGVERFRFGCFGPAKLTLVYVVIVTPFHEDGEMIGSRRQ